MKVFRKLFATILVCTFVMAGINYENGFALDVSELEAMPGYVKTESLETRSMTSNIIYTYSGTNVSKSETSIYTYNLSAYEMGYINLRIGISGGLKKPIGFIGSLAYKEDLIECCYINGSRVTEQKSSSYGNGIEEGTHIISFGNNNYSSWDLKGRVLYDVSIMVRDTSTPLVLNLFDEDIKIPFGEPFIDKDTYIQELENKVTELENKITELESNPITPYKPGDINGDGIIDATDASSILCYYAYVMTGGDGNLNILDFVENEDEYMAANVTSTTTTVPITTTTTTQTTTTTTTTPSMDIGGSESNYESEFSSNNTGGIRNQFNKKPMAN